MTVTIEPIQGGSVTSAKGFLAGSTYAGLKTHEEDTLDLGILVSEQPATVAATFSTNRILSPSVTLSRRRAENGSARGVVANSGCANCCVGTQGLTDAEEMAALAANQVGVSPEDMLVCSTGMIGVELPMGLIRQSIGNITVTAEGGHGLARAIMTTDTRPKSLAIAVELEGRKITLVAWPRALG